MRQALLYAHRYKNLTALSMHDMLVHALESLFEINAITDGAVAALPTEEELATIRDGIQQSGNHSKTVALMDFEIFQEDPETLFPIAEMFMGKRREELSSADRRLKISGIHAGSTLNPGRKTKRNASDKL
ncbi:MAG: hypothetical protein ABFC57_04315 [Veillonellales bacterium]